MKGPTGWWVQALVLSAMGMAAGHSSGQSDDHGNDAAGVTLPRSVPLVTSASRAAQQGFLRIINRSGRAGTVRVHPVDDAGTGAGPVTLSLDPRAAQQFNSEDLESGNARKGLSGGVGAGEGDWRVAFPTDLDILPLAYIRTPDGFLTSVHDTVPEAGGSHYVAIFNPASNYRQRSLLRLINPGGEDAEVTIDGLDDAGAPPPNGPVRLSLPAGRSVTVSAEQLEDGGPGLRGAFGDGAGKWRLFVTSSAPIRAMSLMDTPTGNLTNLSTLGLGAVGRVAGDGTTAHGIPLVTSASRAAQQGFLRVINRSDRAGTVRIHAVDDAGTRAGPIELSLGARAARQFNSGDLESGNAAKSLSGGVGGGHGDWRLELSTDLDILPLAYIRTPDGFLTSVHDTVPEADGSHYVAIFNPASNYRQRSLLRLVNAGGEDAEVTIDGLDDAGAAPSGGPVRLSLPAGQSTTVSAEQLEDGGPGLRGAFGDGAGKWRLFVRSSVPIHAMSLMDTPTGNLTNLSTVGPLDRRSGAPLLAPGAAADGSLDGPGDVDLWRIDVPSRGRVVIETSGGTDTVGRLEDASGRLLAEDDNGGAGGNFRIELDLDPGTYYLRLSGSGGAAGGYRLSFRHAPEGAGVAFSSGRAVTTDADGAASVYAADLDADGDVDVLSASWYDDKIAWYENEGGGTFSTSRTIAATADNVYSVHAADLDGDGDADVLSASYSDDRIAWYENEGGGAFSAPRTITTDADGAFSVHAADLDGDGDADVLSASIEDDRIAWYENEGGGVFSAARTVAADAETSVHAADLDGDGDADVLSASFRNNRIAWYENWGGGALSAGRTITADAVGAMSVHAADLDGDGDADVLSASHEDNRIAWYENEGGGAFSRPRTIAADADGARFVHAADLDGDGDADVLSASEIDDRIVWYENEGGGAFLAARTLAADADGAHSVYAADLDGDGDADVLSASLNDDKIAWYRNQSDHGDDRRDTPDGAMLVTALPAFLHGTLESVRDRDVFRIATGSGTLRAYSNGPADTFGRLLDGTGAVLASNDDAGAGANFRVEAEVGAGVHYVEVGGFEGTATGPYTLSIEFVGDGGGIGYGLSGRVTDSRSSDFAISGATIRLESGQGAGRTATTGPDGQYRFDNLSGTLTLKVTAEPSYVAKMAEITMNANRTIDFALEHTGKPPFGGTVFVTPDLITPSDPTSLTDVTYVGRGARDIWNPLIEAWEGTDAYLFNVRYAGQVLEFQVHPHFENREAARSQVDTYASALGRLPAVLLSGAREVEISNVDHPWQANGQLGLFFMYTRSGEGLIDNGFLEEVLIHESGHVSLDLDHADKPGWLAAQAADGVFVSDYARDFPAREDVAESILPYFALRYRPDRLSDADRLAIAAAIPNRLRYFDEQGFDMSPYTRMESTVSAVAPSSSERPRIWRPFESPFIGPKK